MSALTEQLGALLRECRQRPEAPPDGADPGEHWHFLWRSALAAMLTWQFALLYGAVVVIAIVWGVTA